MKTDTTEKGLESHITQTLCSANAYEERHFSLYNRADCVDDDFTISLDEQKRIVSHLKTETATIDYAIAKTNCEIELNQEYKEAMVSDEEEKDSPQVMKNFKTTKNTDIQ